MQKSDYRTEDRKVLGAREEKASGTQEHLRWGSTGQDDWTKTRLNWGSLTWVSCSRWKYGLVLARYRSSRDKELAE